MVRVIARQMSGKNCLAAIFASRHQDASLGPLGNQKIGKGGFLGGGSLGDVLVRLKPAKSKRGREEGDGTENVINCRDVCRKLS